MNRPLVILYSVLCAVLFSPEWMRADAESFDFSHEILPILAKVGCSAAECHGGATGQGGFKLSLFAAEPLLDYQAIVQELDGRRLDRLHPEHSLFLRKPSRMGVKHKGGRLLHKDDALYGSLRDWIEDGAPFRRGAVERLTGLEIFRSDDRYRVDASFETEEGTVVRDVTSLALLESTNEQVAIIHEDGRVQARSPGETWFLARYGQFSSRVAFRTAFDSDLLVSSVSSVHSLDQAWRERLGELGLKSLGAASETTLVRRLYFDLTGRPPDVLELEAFLKADPSDRVARTAARLVDTVEFSHVFSRAIAGFFEIPVAGKDPRNAEKRNDRLRAFFFDAVSSRMTLEKIADAVLVDSEAENTWRHFADPRDRAEYIGRTLLGMRIGCARCHNHPLDRWTNQEHLAFSAYFTDPRPGPKGAMMAGKFFLPGEGTAVVPRLLPVSLLDAPPSLNREEEVSWLVREGARDQFAKNMGNRIFGLLMGRSLVDLSDDHRLTNPAIHESILDLLATTFIELDTDLRAFVQYVVTSDLYALGSVPPDFDSVSGDPERRYLARREARSLTSEQLKEAVEFVLGVPISADPPPESPLARQLYLMNSGMLQNGLNTEGNQVEIISFFESDPSTQLSELYRLILSRDPSESERNAFFPLLRDADNPEQTLKDLAFALLASREFGSVR